MQACYNFNDTKNSVTVPYYRYNRLFCKKKKMAAVQVKDGTLDNTVYPIDGSIRVNYVVGFLVAVMFTDKSIWLHSHYSKQQSIEFFFILAPPTLFPIIPYISNTDDMLYPLHPPGGGAAVYYVLYPSVHPLLSIRWFFCCYFVCVYILGIYLHLALSISIN